MKNRSGMNGFAAKHKRTKVCDSGDDGNQRIIKLIDVHNFRSPQPLTHLMSFVDFLGSCKTSYVYTTHSESAHTHSPQHTHTLWKRYTE